jgi:hypothetical protein
MSEFVKFESTNDQAIICPRRAPPTSSAARQRLQATPRPPAITIASNARRAST